VLAYKRSTRQLTGEVQNHRLRKNSASRSRRAPGLRAACVWLRLEWFARCKAAHPPDTKVCPARRPCLGLLIRSWHRASRAPTSARLHPLHDRQNGRQEALHGKRASNLPCESFKAAPLWNESRTCERTKDCRLSSAPARRRRLSSTGSVTDAYLAHTARMPPMMKRMLPGGAPDGVMIGSRYSMFQVGPKRLTPTLKTVVKKNVLAPSMPV